MSPKPTPTAPQTLPPELAELFEAATPVSDLDLKGLAKAVLDLENDPMQVADATSAIVTDDILQGLAETGQSKAALAERIGMKRQQIQCLLDEENPHNYTIKTLAKFAAALDRHLVVRLLDKQERVLLSPIVTRPIGVFSPSELWQPGFMRHSRLREAKRELLKTYHTPATHASIPEPTEPIAA